MFIKNKVKESGIPQWKIAWKLGVTEMTLIRWLRVPDELALDKVSNIEKAINDLLAEK